MFKLMDKKIIAILRSNILLKWRYVISTAYIQMHFILLLILEANPMNPDQTAPKGAV